MASIFIFAVHIIVILGAVGVAGMLFESRIANGEGYKRFRRRMLLRTLNK